MSVYRKPKGRYQRSTGDWFIDRMMGGATGVSAVAAQYAFVALYNNSTAGNMLHVKALSGIAFNVNAQLNVDMENGIFGAAGKVAVPIWFFAPKLDGIIYQGTTATQYVGHQVYAISGGQVPDHWPYDWPIAILPPGYSLLVQCDTVNVGIDVSLQWLVMSATEGFY